MAPRYYYDFDETEDEFPFTIMDTNLVGYHKIIGKIGSRDAAEKIVKALNNLDSKS